MGIDFYLCMSKMEFNEADFLLLDAFLVTNTYWFPNKLISTNSNGFVMEDWIACITTMLKTITKCQNKCAHARAYINKACSFHFPFNKALNGFGQRAAKYYAVELNLKLQGSQPQSHFCIY